ncbi:hypothetical protein VP01_636g2 [Puccinia sorghi]|uniref:Major facilitator superfamily (MFS) profile domain-containing protein n=1 Tax=Puccinia sorghi TaxID=27349 RepID=A0A0L6UG11_9BASI|nr:hypothetical protein VP01_636g2 [Puccinia sorghi]
MEPSYIVTSHDSSTFHYPPTVEHATISSRPKTLALDTLDTFDIKNNSRVDLDLHSAVKERERNLAPIDGGFLAWRFIFLAFLVEGFVWGIPLSFGVFLDFDPYSQMSSTMAAIIGQQFPALIFVNFHHQFINQLALFSYIISVIRLTFFFWGDFTGTLCTGILYCIGSFVMSLMNNFPKSAVYFPTIGTLVCSGSFLAASYSTNAWQLLLCQGIVYGIGGVSEPCSAFTLQVYLKWLDSVRLENYAISYPALFFLAEWWVVKRGLAGSIMFAGELHIRVRVDHSTCSRLGVEEIWNPCDSAWSWGGISDWHGSNITFLSWASPRVCQTPCTPRYNQKIFQETNLLGIPFIECDAEVYVEKKQLLQSFDISNGLKFKDHILSRHFTCPPTPLRLVTDIIILQTIFKSLRAIPHLKTGSPGGIVLGLFAGSSTIGQIVTGALSDHYDLNWIIGLTSVASSVSIFVLWGYSEGFLMLAAFAVVYGISAGGFSCLWQRFAMIIAPSEPNASGLVVYFATSRGIANVLTGPIAGALLQSSSSTKAGYKSLVYYSGSLMVLCTVGVFTRGLYRIMKH